MIDGQTMDPVAACDREAIHQLGTIQPFGFLIAVDEAWTIIRASDTAERDLGRPREQILGASLLDLFGREALHALRNRMAQLTGGNAVERMFGVALLAETPDALFDCAVHRSGELLVFEAETSAPTDPSETASVVRAMIGRLDASADLTSFLQQGARQIQGLTGFDRVMVYRFRSDGAGEVVAEVARGRGGRLLGLRYPASDIPSQARALYLRTPFRIIADVTATPSVIVSANGAADPPLDLSLSVLRAVSPVHIEYLTNMGVAASLSISIIVEGRLWGLFACHHFKARRPGFEARTLAELFGQMFAMKLEGRELAAAAAFATAGRATADRLLAGVAADVGRLDDPDWIAATIGGIIPCDGVCIRLNGRVARGGATPGAALMQALDAWLAADPPTHVVATDHLAGLLACERDESGIAGMLCIPISRGGRDHVLLFRREQVLSVVWAGNPDKAALSDPATGRLRPRRSFADWTQEVRGRSDAFTDAELGVAETLRVTMVDIVRGLADAAAVERQRAIERQEVLIAELNHRVRNVLALISGLVRQSHDPTLATADFIEVLDGRIQALARAHNQITMDNWGPAKLRPLLEAAGAGHVASGRLRLEGDAVLLDPAALSTLALVVHELMTNSAKHGALSSTGHVAIDWRLDAGGALLVRWREHDGPPVPPQRRSGLGTTIIERSIPYELGGEAHVDYAPTGLRAHFTIPASHVHRDDVVRTASSPIPAGPAPPQEAAPAPGIFDGDFLIVEDSFLIALHVEEILLQLGANGVTRASSVAEAIAALDHGRPAAAILDLNLGLENSFPIADRLRADGIPFVFATGYGDQLKRPARHRDVIVLQKPYTKANLAEALGR